MGQLPHPSSLRRKGSTRRLSIDGLLLRQVRELVHSFRIYLKSNSWFRYYDRLWIRRRSLCPSRSLLDVSILLHHLLNIYISIHALCSFGPNHLRAVWRLSLGLGLIPAVAVFIWRLNMEEPTRFKKDSMKNAKIPYLLIIRRYWKSLAAISATWCVGFI